MQIQVCPRSFGSGLLAGAAIVLAVWYGYTLSGRAEITQLLLAQAKCDPAGFVAITFADASQFTCVPQAQMPPTNRADAERRRKGGRG